MARRLGSALPLIHFLQVLRGILLKGFGIAKLWREVAALAGLAMLLVTVGVRCLHKAIEGASG